MTKHEEAIRQKQTEMQIMAEKEFIRTSRVRIPDQTVINNSSKQFYFDKYLGWQPIVREKV